jgi:predicted amidohydrolase
MVRAMRVAVAQMDIAWMDRTANWATIRRMVGSANLSKGDYLLLPELADTGFTMDPPPEAGPDPMQAAAELARAHGLWVQMGHAERAADGVGIHNAASIIRPDGSLAGRYRKIHLFSPAREDRHYRPGESVTLVDVASADGTWRIAPLICYDLRFPELFRLAALAGAEVFMIGASWPAPRALHRRALAVARAIENQAYVVACNRVGNDPNAPYAGDSFVVAPSGEIVAEGGDAENVLVANLDRGELVRWRDKFPAMRDLRRSLLGNVRID